jgi:anti-sigma B factor antagonist/stage II sporulation protein AA (anti-sigma F factor antagonist)
MMAVRRGWLGLSGMDGQAANWSERGVGDAVLMSASGRIDLSNAEAFKDALSASMARAKAALILDLSGVDYISSAGLRALMITFKAGKADGKAFGIAALQPLLLEIFTISRFNLVFPLFDTVRQAIDKLAPGANDGSHAS